jgi:23S rRNA (adenine2503-C2)-methyltransferase
VVEAQVSNDGTRKWLLRTHDGHDFEMVFIPTPTAARCASRARSAAR